MSKSNTKKKTAKTKQDKQAQKEAAMKQAQNESLIIEIEEAIKQEKLENLWKNYGSFLIGGALFIVLATAAFVGWRSYNDNKNAEKTKILIAAMDADDQAKSLADIMPELSGGTEFVALFTAAGLMIGDGNHTGALELYRKGSQDKTLPHIFRDLATYMAVQLEWSDSEKPDSDKLLAELAPLWQDESNPWRWHARLQTAMILAQDKHDYQGAREQLTQVMLQDGVPPTLSEKAKSLDHIYYLLQQTAAKDAPAAAQTPAQSPAKAGKDEEQQG